MCADIAYSVRHFTMSEPTRGDFVQLSH
jgi:hypothetical protein